MQQAAYFSPEAIFRLQVPNRLRPVRCSHALLFLSLITLGMTTDLNTFEAPESLAAVSIAFVALAAWTLWSWFRVNSTLLDPYGLFLMSSWTFNGGQVFLEVFQLNPNGLLGAGFSPQTLLKTEYLVALAIASMHMGALWVHRGATVDPGVREQRDLAWHTRWVGWFLLAIAAGPATLVLWNSGKSVMAGGYISLYRNVDAGLVTAPRVLANFLMPAGLFLLAGSKAKRTGVIVSSIGVIAGATAIFFLGQRGEAASALVAYVWLYSRTIRPIPLRYLIVPALVVTFVVFPMVRAVRDTKGSDRLSLDNMTSTWTSIDNPAIETISEMGNSMSTTAYTLDLIPLSRPLDYGTSYLFALFAAVPNVAWDLHPTAAHGTLSNWLIKTVSPEIARNGGGLGYSYIAEAYLNFGWVGVPFVLFFSGCLVGRLSVAVRKSADPAILALAGCVLLCLLMYARAESADLVRNACWYGVAPYLVVRILSGVRR